MGKRERGGRREKERDSGEERGRREKERDSGEEIEKD